MSDWHPARFLRFRKRDRDLAQDERRFALLHGAIGSALSSTEAERAGLARRVEDLRGWVGELTGNDCGTAGQRDAADERELVAAERLLMAGIDRLARLDDMRDLFRTMARLLDTAGAAPTRASRDAADAPRRAVRATA